MSTSPSATFSEARPAPTSAARRAILAAAVLLPTLLGAVRPQALDCVAAHVNRRAITLTDIRVLQAFRLGEEVRAGEESPTPKAVLEKAIDRQIVVDLMRGNFPVPEEEVAARLSALKARFAPEEWQRLLAEFGITESGIESYIENFLLYERMVAIRFGQSPEVTVQEMQEYYDREYAPAQESSGLEPKPMGQVMGEIEERLRDRKRDAQISDWIRGLRSQAEVSIHDGCLANLR